METSGIYKEEGEYCITVNTLTPPPKGSYKGPWGIKISGTVMLACTHLHLFALS